MNKESGFGVLAVIVITILGIIMCVGGGYNGLVGAEENVRGRWGDVQVMEQRRLDVVNQFVPVVNAVTAEEQAVFNDMVLQAAALTGALKFDEFGQPIIPEGQELEDLLAAIQNMDRALINFISFAADNPEFMSGEIFQNFLTAIEGSENRIAVARRDYNAAVEGYRRNVRSFPANILAGMFGFRQDAFPYFAASDEAQNAPDIVLNTPVP